VLPRPLPSLLALAAALTVAPAAAAEQRTLQLLSDRIELNPPDQSQYLAGVSDDGSHVFFDTNGQLLPSDTDIAADVYERSGTGALTHISDSPGPDGDNFVSLYDVSADGAVTTLSTRERLLPTDADDELDLYSRIAGLLIHVTDDPLGPDGNDPAFFLAASPDGATVLFVTDESLAATDTDFAQDVYSRRLGGPPIHLTDTVIAADANTAAQPEGLTEDATRVAFRTSESLAASDTDTDIDVYEIGPSGRRHLSDDPTGPDAELSAKFGGYSPGGTRVYFTTDESLAATDTDSAADVYERATTGTFRHISDDPTGPDANAEAEFSGVSGEGDRVRFRTNERMAASDTDNEADLYELSPGGELTHVTRDPTGTEDAYPADVVGASGDGTRVYVTTLERMAPTDQDQTYDLYERVGDGDLQHISEDPTGADDAKDVYFQAASYDGRRVLFSTAESLVAGDTDTSDDVYERAPGGELVAVSDRDDGPDPNEGAFVAAASRDGTRVYITTAGRLVPADTDNAADVHVSTVVPDPPPAGPPPAGEAPAPRDTTAPRLTRVRVVRGRLRFTLSEAADVKVVVRGRRTLRLAGRPAGANRVRLRVRRGSHRLAITAVDAAGNRSAAKRIRFRVR
jgi:Tol biopolymer transport system component